MLHEKVRLLIDLFNNPKHLSKNEFISIYVASAVLPNIIVLILSSILYLDTEFPNPDFWLVISSVFLAPFLETIIFFIPLAWLIKNTPHKLHFLLLIITATSFAAGHYVIGSRAGWTIFLPFWLGVVMAIATKIAVVQGKSTLLLISGIHAIYNMTALSVLYFIYYITTLEIDRKLQLLCIASVGFLIIYAILLYVSKVTIGHKCN